MVVYQKISYYGVPIFFGILMFLNSNIIMNILTFYHQTALVVGVSLGLYFLFDGLREDNKNSLVKIPKHEYLFEDVLFLNFIFGFVIGYFYPLVVYLLIKGTLKVQHL